MTIKEFQKVIENNIPKGSGKWEDYEEAKALIPEDAFLSTWEQCIDFCADWVGI